MNLESALSWLKNSGVQISEGDDAGGVYAWLDEGGGGPSFVYSEITGYFMTLCAHLARYQPDSDWLQRAELAAGWIADRAMDETGAILARKYAEPRAADPYSFENKRVIYFDSGMVGYGLVLTHLATGNGRWLEVARKVADFMLEAFEPEGSKQRYAAYDLPDKCQVPAGERWSQYFGPYELKSSLFFSALADCVDDGAGYMAHVDRVLASTLAAQKPEGRFPTIPGGDATHLHPHTYTVEGLLHLAANHGRKDLLPAVGRALDWSFRTCLGSERLIQQWSARDELVIPELRSDVLAQSLRAYYVYKRFEPSAAFAWEDRLPALHAVHDGFQMASGAISYGQDEHGVKSVHANAWCHMFAVEMQLYRDQLVSPELPLILT